MLVRVTRTYAIVACVVMVALVASAYAGGQSCAPGSPCTTCSPCVAGSPCYAGAPCPTHHCPQPCYYCVNGRCCQPSHPWGFSQRQWMPWPDEIRDDVGSPAVVSGRVPIPTPEGVVPESLPKEVYAAPEGQDGIGNIQIEGSPGTGEAPMPFDIPQVDQSGPGAGLPGLPGLPEGDIPLEQEEGTLTPDILPAKPFSIEGTEDDELPAVPEAEEKPTSQNRYEITPLPATTATPLPATRTRIQLGEAPLPTSEPSSLIVQKNVVQEAMPQEMVSETEMKPLPATSEPVRQAAPIEDYVATQEPPAYAPAPLPSVRPSSYLPSREPAPIVDAVEEVTPAYSTPAPIESAPVSEAWQSRRTRSAKPAPLPTTQTPVEGRHVTYEQTPEAPMPEVTQVPAVIENQKPLALDGYCPVELVLNERWVEGDAKWTATHDGRSYQFSSREAFDSFCRSPELYAPYYAGVDPIVALVGGGMVDGRTDMCAVYHGRLYMFSSQESLEQFRANPAQCIKAFEANLRTK